MCQPKFRYNFRPGPSRTESNIRFAKPLYWRRGGHFFVMDRCSLPSFELSPADSVGPRWEWRLARFENYLVVTIDCRRRSPKGSITGCDVFDIYTALPTQPETFSATKTALTEHFSPKRNRDFEVFGFGYLLNTQRKLWTSLSFDCVVWHDIVSLLTWKRRSKRRLSKPACWKRSGRKRLWRT